MIDGQVLVVQAANRQRGNAGRLPTLRIRFVVTVHRANAFSVQN